jgi:tetratricopeptide (TPR) repeat protein
MISHRHLGLPAELATSFEEWIALFGDRGTLGLWEFNATGRTLAVALKTFVGPQTEVTFEPEDEDGGLAEAETIPLLPDEMSSRYLQAKCDFDQGRSLASKGDPGIALVKLQRAVEGLAELFQHFGEDGVAIELARSHDACGCLQNNLGNPAQATEAFGKAIDIYSRLGNKEGDHRLLAALANACSHRGIANSSCGQVGEAIQDLDRAIEIYTSLVYDANRSLLESDLANAHMYRGLVLFAQQKSCEATADLDVAIDINTRVVEEDGISVVGRHLADAHHHRGTIFLVQGRHKKATWDFGKALDILTRLTAEEQQAELQEALAASLNAQAWLYATSQDHGIRNPAESVAMARKACEISDWLNWQCVDTLAAAYAAAGDYSSAKRCQRKANDLAPEEVQKELRDKLALYDDGKPYQV